MTSSGSEIVTIRSRLSRHHCWLKSGVVLALNLLNTLIAVSVQSLGQPVGDEVPGRAVDCLAPGVLHACRRIQQAILPSHRSHRRPAQPMLMPLKKRIRALAEPIRIAATQRRKDTDTALAREVRRCR